MKKNVSILFLLLSLFLAGCGDSNDDLNQVSGQQGNVGQNAPTPTATGTITGQVIDATTGQGLPGVTVTVPATNVAAQGALTATTDASGNYTIFNAPVGTYTITFQASQFVSFSREVTVVEGQTATVATVVLSPGLTTNERFRFVLTWNETPVDLDSHLWLPEANPFHLFFEQKGSNNVFPFASLDVDDITSYGPETVTINQVLTGGTYEYGIHNYSQTGTVAGAVVQIYDQTGLIATVTPTDTNGEYWVVATIDGATGDLEIVDETLADIRSPYEVNAQGAALVLPTK